MVATYTKSMSREWFMGFLKQLAQDNQNQLIEVKGTGLVFHCTGINKVWNAPTFVYSLTGTFGTLKAVTPYTWMIELDLYIADVQRS